jgi:hypothetical protein
MDTEIEGQVQKYRWFEIWKEVYFHPGAQTFESLLAEGQVKAKPAIKQQRALVWAVISGVVASLILMLSIFTVDPGFDPANLCWSPILGALAGTMIVLLVPYFFHALAEQIGGQGEWYDLFYCFSMIIAPAALVMVLIIAVGQFLGAVSPFLKQALLLLSVAWLYYPFVLTVLSIRAVEGLETRKAVGVVLVPASPAIFFIFFSIFNLYPQFLLQCLVGNLVVVFLLAFLCFLG